MLLKHFQIDKPFKQFAEHNEQKALPPLILQLKSQNGALITDAGTPGISDPGFRLVRACVEAGIKVVPIPGANAAISALSVSGLPTDRFLFIGFAPRTENKLIKKMLRKKTSELDPTEKALIEQHPVIGQTSLQHIQKLLPVSLLIRHHHERYDGIGYPDNLRRERIPAGSRIIAIADFFDKLINPSDGGERYSVDRAFFVLEKEAGRRFDPLLVGKFNEALHEFSHDVIEADTREIDVDELKEGMLLASDVRTKRGLLLMASGEVIKPVHLDKINKFHKIDPVIARISIKVRGNK